MCLIFLLTSLKHPFLVPLGSYVPFIKRWFMFPKKVKVDYRKTYIIVGLNQKQYVILSF